MNVRCIVSSIMLVCGSYLAQAQVEFTQQELNKIFKGSRLQLIDTTQDTISKSAEQIHELCNLLWEYGCPQQANTLYESYLKKLSEKELLSDEDIQELLEQKQIHYIFEIAERRCIVFSNDVKKFLKNYNKGEMEYSEEEIKQYIKRIVYDLNYKRCNEKAGKNGKGDNKEEATGAAGQTQDHI